jgi:ActD protein
MNAPIRRYGLLAVYREPEPLVAAAAELKRRGQADLDAFTPFPVADLDDVLGADSSALPWIVLAGGILGALAAYLLVLYSVEIDYPINVGGRPLNAWPAYLVLAFEGGILGAALAGFVGMLALNRLPTYYHPVFNASIFTFAKGDRFYLLVRDEGRGPDETVVREVLDGYGAIAIEEVAP